MSEIVISIKDNPDGRTAKIEIMANPALVIMEPKTEGEKIAVALIDTLIEINPELFGQQVEINKGFDGEQAAGSN